MFKIKNRIYFGILFIVSLFFTEGCADDQSSDRVEFELNRTGKIQVSGSKNQPELIMEGLRVIDESGVAYGIDFKKRLPYKLNLQSGEFKFLGNQGQGPAEFSQPSLLTVKNSDEIFVFDTAQDQIVYISEDEVIEKIEGYARHGIWLRHIYGFYWNGKIITAMKEPDRINALDFINAQPISMLNLSDSTLTKHGKFSPTLDELDSLQKYPLLAFDEQRNVIYYVFRSDYSVMVLDLETDSVSVANSYKPSEMRTRTIPFDSDNSYHFTVEFSKQLNEDRTQLVGVDIMQDQLVVVHQNTHAEFFENRDPQFIDYFGIAYDLPDLSNPREFTLPGKLLGTWENKLLIEENDDPLEYTIGFYVLSE